MGNKPPIILPTGQWVNLNDVIEGGVEEGKTYILQADNNIRVWEGNAVPAKYTKIAGLKISPNSNPFAWTCTENNSLFILARRSRTVLNVVA